MATSSFLEIEKLKNNENAKITIVGFQDLALLNQNAEVEGQTPLSQLGMVSGYVVENTSFQFGSEFSSANNTVGELLGGIGGAYGKVHSALDDDYFFNQRILTSAIGTMQNWKGSAPFGFTLPTVFVASSEAPEDNPMLPVKTLMQAVLPRFKDVNWTGGAVEQMISPNNYSPGSISHPKGTFSLKIGRWFDAKNRPFIIKDVSFEMSKEVIITGVPLYVKASITFETYRVFPIEDVQSWMAPNPQISTI